MEIGMIELGKTQCLNVVKIVDFGIYLGTEEDKVLLPKKQVPQDIEVGDALTVFVYRDSSDRLIATTKTPKLELGQIAKLKVSEVGKIGAFLDWGLEKDLFLPFKEQTAKVQKGDKCLVALYVDKSGRLCATMKVYHMLRTDSPYQKDDQVKGIAYDRSDEFGVFVAVDHQFSARIPKKDVFGKIRIGDEIEARVTNVKEDGKLDLSVRGKIPQQMDADAELILKRIQSYDGVLPFNDKADPDTIKAEFGMSKAAFKRAVGRLLKENRVKIFPDSIRIR